MTSPSRRPAIGLFGGSFDPVHNGHLHIARSFADELALDTVIFLPAGDPYHKGGSRTDARHRLAMAQLAAQADPRFAVSDCDIVRRGATYSSDTAAIFRQNFPAADLWWLLGADSLNTLHTWKNWRQFADTVNIAVARRADGGTAPTPTHAESAAWQRQAEAAGSLKTLSAPLHPASSTDIRRALAGGGDAGALLPPEVAAYIRHHRLYHAA